MIFAMTLVATTSLDFNFNRVLQLLPFNVKVIIGTIIPFIVIVCVCATFGVSIIVDTKNLDMIFLRYVQMGALFIAIIHTCIVKFVVLHLR